MNSQGLQTITETLNEGYFHYSKDLLPSERKKGSYFLENHIHEMDQNELESLATTINTRLDKLHKHKIQNAFSRQFEEVAPNEIRLFTEQRPKIDEGSPLQQSPLPEESILSLERRMSTPLQSDLTQTKKVSIRRPSSISQQGSSLGKRRGSAIRINTTTKKFEPLKGYETVSPSYKLDHRKSAKPKIMKKTTLIAKFRAKFGIEAGQRNVEEIKEIEKEMSLKTQNDSQSLFPIVLGIIGLILMLQIYLY